MKPYDAREQWLQDKIAEVAAAVPPDAAPPDGEKDPAAERISEERVAAILHRVRLRLAALERAPADEAGTDRPLEDLVARVVAASAVPPAAAPPSPGAAPLGDERVGRVMGMVHARLDGEREARGNDSDARPAPVSLPESYSVAALAFMPTGVRGLSGQDAPHLAGYQITGVLGRGGMGVVYRAIDTSRGRTVALKTIALGHRADPGVARRFQREIAAAASLCHPHIVNVYDAGIAQGSVYCAMEFAGGGSLAGRLTGAPQPVQDAVRLVACLAEAVHAAHTRGIIHRDLKPANVLFTAEGTPKVTDFGLAGIVQDAGASSLSGTVLGTPQYMAPEQVTGRPAGAAADQYTLGVMFYELLTGRPPFRGRSPLDTLLQAVREEPPPPSRLNREVPRSLDAICLRCLQKDPADRYASARDLADALRRFGDDAPPGPGHG